MDMNTENTVQWPAMRFAATVEDALSFVDQQAPSLVHVLHDDDGLATGVQAQLWMNDGADGLLYEPFANVNVYVDPKWRGELDDDAPVHIGIQLYPGAYMVARNILPEEVAREGVKRVLLAPTPLYKLTRFAGTQDFRIWIRQVVNLTKLVLPNDQVQRLEDCVRTLLGAIGMRREPFDRAVEEAEAADRAAAEARMPRLADLDMRNIRGFVANVACNRAVLDGADEAAAEQAAEDALRKFFALPKDINAAVEFIYELAGFDPTKPLKRKEKEAEQRG